MYVDGKKLVSDALASISNVTVTASYQIAMKNLPSILFTEVVNVPTSKGTEQRTSLAYAIDVYSKTSTTSLAKEVDAVMSALGFKRGQCLDLDDPTGIRHKNMKYTGVYDLNTDLIYQE